MSMGDSGLFKGTMGARAAEADAPIGFDETPPDTEMLPTSMSGASAVSCRDHLPRTIAPEQTNGGRIRSMDNHQLAKWLSDFSFIVRSADYVFDWLNQPCSGAELGLPEKE